MSEIASFFRSLPLFTRYWFALSIAFPLLSRFRLLKATYLILDYNAFIHQFQIWRPVTAVFYYPLGASTAFSFLLNLYFLYNYSVRLETGAYGGRPADYCFLLLFNWMCIVITALMFNMWMLMDPMIMSILYVWCQINKDVIVNFWFGTQFKAVYLPWVLFAFNFILSGGDMDDLVGIIVGHLYFFLTYKYPQEYNGRVLLQTPQILYDYFPNTRGPDIRGFGQPPPQRRPEAERGGHRWGRGHVLGQ